VTTPRLHLVPIGPDQVDALNAGASEFAARLGVGTLPGSLWPPEMFAEHLEALAQATVEGGDEELGWWCWAIVQHAEAIDEDDDTGDWIIEPLEAGPRLVGLAIFLGPPIPNPETDDEREASIAIALIDDMTGYGLGTEALKALTRWALDPARGEHQPQRLFADVLTSMEAAKHMLRKCGFRRIGHGEEPGSEVFGLERP
jgi:RimJ/RimL family protein N-acetyltransferase